MVGLLLLSAGVVATVARGPVAVAAGNCASGATMNIVAHQDDDILFQSPNLLHEVQAGRCVRSVYVTAGDANQDQWYWMERENGPQAAYAKMAGVANAWTTADAGIPGHPIPVLTLTGAPNISLVFMRLPDGNVDGTGFDNNGDESLQKLYTGTIGTIHAIDGSSAYTKAGLISTLLALMNSYGPNSINTQDYVGAYNDGDHSDHHTVAYLVQQAQSQYAVPHGFAGYQGYGITSRPSNVSKADTTAKTNAFLAYAPHDYRECQTAAICAGGPEGTWFSRQYTVGTPIPIPPVTTTGATTPPTTRP